MNWFEECLPHSITFDSDYQEYYCAECGEEVDYEEDE